MSGTRGAVPDQTERAPTGMTIGLGGLNEWRSNQMEHKFMLWMKNGKDLWVQRDSGEWKAVDGSTADQVNWTYHGDTDFATGEEVVFEMKVTGVGKDGYGGYAFKHGHQTSIWDPDRTDEKMLTSKVETDNHRVTIHLPSEPAEGYFSLTFFNGRYLCTYDPQIRCDTGHPSDPVKP